MQDTMNANCLDENREVHYRFQEYKYPDYNIQRLLASNGDDLSVNEEDQNDIDSHMYEIIYTTFSQSHIHLRNGILLGLYRVVGIATVIMSLLQYMDEDKSNELWDNKYISQSSLDYDPITCINFWAFAFPITAWLYDSMIGSLINRREKMQFKFIKILLTLIYWGTLTSALLSYKSDPIEIFNVKIDLKITQRNYRRQLNSTMLDLIDFVIKDDESLNLNLESANITSFNFKTNFT